MIPFFDTSFLVKLYISEEGSEKAEALVKELGCPNLSQIARVEFHSAIGRKKRQKELSEPDSRTVLLRFSKEWDAFGKIHPSNEILMNAADLTGKHPLAALDAIHLASALSMARCVDEPVLFLTADNQLEAAARQEKLQTQM